MYRMPRLKYDYEMLKNICDEGGVTLLVDYTDQYVTRDTRIIGKCILCENSFDKSLNKLHKQRNFGCESCAKILKFERISKADYQTIQTRFEKGDSFHNWANTSAASPAWTSMHPPRERK